MNTKPRFPIGTEYVSRNQRRCKVVDIWTTTNQAGQVVAVRYVSEHITMGQIVRERDVLETTIAKGLDA